MTQIRFAVLAALLASCGPDTTSFRTTDKSDGEAHTPAAAVYDVRAGARVVARVHVWSGGGYLGTNDEPMTHIGFDVENVGRQPVSFDGDALALSVFDSTGAALPAASFTTVTPIGPSQVVIAPGARATLDSYFMIPVALRVVDHMQVRWSLRIGNDRHVGTTSFTRDDEFPVIDNRREPSQSPRS